jgi:hypothetical protein
VAAIAHAMVAHRSLRRAVVIGLAPLILHAATVCFGPVGFDALLAAALTGKAGFLALAAIWMGIATAMQWGRAGLKRQ